MVHRGKTLEPPWLESADVSQVMNCIACLEVPGSMGNGLLIYMMVMDARQRNEANRAISIGKRHTDCPTGTLCRPWLDFTAIMCCL